MKLSQLLLILLARKRLILTTMLFCVCAAAMLSWLMPKTYQANSQVITGYRATDPVTGMMMPQVQMQNYLATQIGIITSRNVALKVVDALQLHENEKFREGFRKAHGEQGDIRDWIADRLLRNIIATPIKEGGLIQITAKSDDAKLAASLANAFAHQYRQASIQIKANPLDEASQYFDKHLMELRAKLEAAQG